MANDDSIANALASASAGDMLEGELIPVVGRGKLRVTYNWLYSALNCNPSDNSPFIWVMSKAEPGKVSLSPKDGYGGRTLYASVRDDWSYFVQVQAPHSADWITQARRDEQLELSELGFLTVNFKGFNGSYLALNNHITAQGGYSGYKLQSNGSGAGESTNMFFSVSKILQENLSVPVIASMDQAKISDLLKAEKVPNAETLAQQIVS